MIATERPRLPCACGRAAVADGLATCALCVHDEVNGAPPAPTTRPMPRPDPVAAYLAALRDLDAARARERAALGQLTEADLSRVAAALT